MTQNFQFTNGVLTSVTSDGTLSHTLKEYTFVNGILTKVNPTSASVGTIISMTFINGIFTSFVSGSTSGSSSGSSGSSTSLTTFNFTAGKFGWYSIYEPIYARQSGAYGLESAVANPFGPGGGIYAPIWEYIPPSDMYMTPTSMCDISLAGFLIWGIDNARSDPMRIDYMKLIDIDGGTCIANTMSTSFQHGNPMSASYTDLTFPTGRLTKKIAKIQLYFSGGGFSGYGQFGCGVTYLNLKNFIV